MKPIYPIAIALLLNWSCESDSHKKEITLLEQKIDVLKSQLDSSDQSSKKMGVKVDSLTTRLRTLYDNETNCIQDPNLEKIEIVNHIFYHEVIRGRSVPRVKKVNGFAKIMLEEFLNGLKKKDIFDSIFLHNQQERFWQCKVDVDKMKFEGVTDLDWEPETCDFFNYYFYIGGQEPPQYYKTTNLVSNPTTATALIRYFDIYKKQEHIWPNYLEMKYVNQNGEWKIQSARLKTE